LGAHAKKTPERTQLLYGGYQGRFTSRRASGQGLHDPSL